MKTNKILAFCLTALLTITGCSKKPPEITAKSLATNVPKNMEKIRSYSGTNALTVSGIETIDGSEIPLELTIDTIYQVLTDNYIYNSETIIESVEGAAKRSTTTNVWQQKQEDVLLKLTSTDGSPYWVATKEKRSEKAMKTNWVEDLFGEEIKGRLEEATTTVAGEEAYEVVVPMKGDLLRKYVFDVSALNDTDISLKGMDTKGMKTNAKFFYSKRLELPASIKVSLPEMGEDILRAFFEIDKDADVKVSSCDFTTTFNDYNAITSFTIPEEVFANAVTESEWEQINAGTLGNSFNIPVGDMIAYITVPFAFQMGDNTVTSAAVYDSAGNEFLYASANVKEDEFYDNFVYNEEFIDTSQFKKIDLGDIYSFEVDAGEVFVTVNDYYPVEGNIEVIREIFGWIAIDSDVFYVKISTYDTGIRKDAMNELYNYITFAK